MTRVSKEDGRWTDADQDRIEIAEYDPRWIDSFEREASSIRSALRTFDNLAIEHFGSTAVPGLAAKPIIDIMLVVSDQSLWPALVSPLEALGYVYWAEDSRKDEMFFVKGMPPFGDRRTHHVHVYLPAEAEHRRLFRDYLIAHSEHRVRYETLKRDLARQFPTDRDGYTLAKRQFVAEILAKPQQH